MLFPVLYLLLCIVDIDFYLSGQGTDDRDSKNINVQCFRIQYHLYCKTLNIKIFTITAIPTWTTEIRIFRVHLQFTQNEGTRLSIQHDAKEGYNCLEFLSTDFQMIFSFFYIILY